MFFFGKNKKRQKIAFAININKDLFYILKNSEKQDGSEKKMMTVVINRCGKRKLKAKFFSP